MIIIEKHIWDFTKGLLIKMAKKGDVYEKSSGC